uniref:BPTI/Kunitz inhibitor domain-containing protein n=1 Tax=Echeneis naucrates TaxID=173247 RepID=A0A665VZA8_ECHNA
ERSGGQSLYEGLKLGCSQAQLSWVTLRCLEPMSEGTCSDYVLLWYFHPRSGECRPFVYGGCGGNRNRFSSRQECQSWCGMERRVGNQNVNVMSFFNFLNRLTLD